MKPLNQRSTPTLAKEIDKLRSARDACRDVFGTAPTQVAKDALKLLDEAITDIEDEIVRRFTP